MKQQISDELRKSKMEHQNTDNENKFMKQKLVELEAHIDALIVGLLIVS